MRILVCGDSFSITDPDYPGLHWTEKILNFSPDFEIANLSYGGCSNANECINRITNIKKEISC